MTASLASREAPEIVGIDDPDDQRIAVFREIRERDLTGRNGFIAEGTVVLDHLAASTRFRPSALLVLRNRLDGVRGRIARLPPECPVFVAERNVIDRIAGFAVHRGVLAHGIDAEPERALPEALGSFSAARPSAPLLVAVGISNHDNVGALFRNARAFGCAGVLLDETSCDPLYRKALRVSVGTVLTQDWRRGGSARDLLAAVEAAGYRPIALTPSAATTPDDLDPSKPHALFVGAEGPGLPRSIIEAAQGCRVAMAGDLDSLNVATSAAIVLSRLFDRR